MWIMTRRLFLMSSLACVGFWSSPGFAQGDNLASLSFSPPSPWVHISRKSSLSQDGAVLKMRLSGARGSMSTILHDKRGYLLGIGTSVESTGKMTRAGVEALNARTMGLSGVDALEEISWSGPLGMSFGKWNDENIVISNILDKGLSIIGSAGIISGWVLVWEPLDAIPAQADIVLGSGALPQLEGLVGSMMRDDKMFVIANSSELDRIMMRQDGKFEFYTNSLYASQFGKLSILKTDNPQ